MLQAPLDQRQELRAGGAVQNTVVGGQREGRHLAHLDLVVGAHHCALRHRPTARMAACGGFRIAVKRSMPNMPRFET